MAGRKSEREKSDRADYLHEAARKTFTETDTDTPFNVARITSSGLRCGVSGKSWPSPVIPRSRSMVKIKGCLQFV